MCIRDRGIPVDEHPQLKVPAVQVVFTQLHAGGKFDNKSYQYSGGLHGVGASVVNALSRKLTVEVAVGGMLYRQEYASEYDDAQKKVIAGKPVTDLMEQMCIRDRPIGWTGRCMGGCRISPTIGRSLAISGSWISRIKK